MFKDLGCPKVNRGIVRSSLMGFTDNNLDEKTIREEGNSNPLLNEEEPHHAEIDFARATEISRLAGTFRYL